MSDRLYGQEFYNNQIYGSLQSAQVYLYHLFSVWGVPESVADIGCGRGAWLATCRDLGVKRVVGFDGEWNSQADMLDPNIVFYPINLEKELSLADSFDLVISLEVAEHLQPESSDSFVNSLSGLSDAVLFGAAFSGQPGVNHINTRPHSFWAGKFISRGYVLFDLFRPTFWNDDRVQPCYRQNTFLYVKPVHPLYLALVNRGYEYSREPRLIDCVHPSVYLGLLKEFIKLQQSLDARSQKLPVPDADGPGCKASVSSDKPKRFDLLVEQAETQSNLNRLDDAAHSYCQALTEKPNDPECLLRLSYVLMQLKRHEESFHHVRHFLRIVDDLAFGYYLAGYTAREIGRWQESRSYLLRAVELDPSHVYARVLCCMSAFTVCMDEAEAQSIMNTYAVELDQLVNSTSLETAEQIDNAVDGIGALSPFFLPYLGNDSNSLQSKYGAWVCSVMAAKYPQYSQPVPLRKSGGRIKIGIISNYFHKHSHWKIAIKGWIEQIDRNRFSIHCFHTGQIRDDITEYAASIADSFLQNSDIDKMIAEVYGHNLDVIIHSGIGMDTNTLKLAGLSLAPVQCTSWGHPLTTGMPTVDYFISSYLMEPPGGDRHYTEKLIRLPNLSIYCTPAEPVNRALADFAVPGERPGDVIILCCQNLLKYLPGYDHVFTDIALRSEKSRFVFIECHVAELTARFRDRLEKAFQDQGLSMAEHVSFVPPLGDSDYAALNYRADIFLDSIGWSGGNTTLESLPFDKPIVSFPGKFMRGRHTYAILKRMGVEETIASSVEEYVSIAVRLANDSVWRAEMSARIAGSKSRIYQDHECIKALEIFLLQVSGRHHGEAYADA